VAGDEEGLDGGLGEGGGGHEGGREEEGAHERRIPRGDEAKRVNAEGAEGAEQRRGRG
jgi:hypothetical protein